MKFPPDGVVVFDFFSVDNVQHELIRPFLDLLSTPTDFALFYLFYLKQKRKEMEWMDMMTGQ